MRWSHGLALLAASCLPLSAAQAAGAILAMTQPAESRVFQRLSTSGGTFGKGEGTVPVAVDLSTAGPLYARTRALDGRSILQPGWQAISLAGAGHSTVRIAGVAARRGGFFLDLATAPEGPWVEGKTPFYMGAIFVQAPSQSLGVLMTRRAPGDKTLADLGIRPASDLFVWATSNDRALAQHPGRWARVSDDGPYGSAFAATFLEEQAQRLGVSTALVGHATGATSIAAFLAPDASEYSRWIASLDQTGGFEGAVGIIGHTDAATHMSGARFALSLRAARSIMARHNPAFGDRFDLAIATVPNISATIWGKPEDWQRIRRAGFEAARAMGGHYVQPDDLELVDGVHPSNAGARTLAMHFARAFAGADESGDAARLGAAGHANGEAVGLAQGAGFASLAGAQALAGGPAFVSPDVQPPGGEWSWTLRFLIKKGAVADRGILVGAAGRGYLYVESDGRLRSGGELPPLASLRKVSDGQWHVARLSATAGGIDLFVDGTLVGHSGAPAPAGYGRPAWIGAFGAPDAYRLPVAVDWIEFGYWGASTRYDFNGTAEPSAP